MENEVNNNVNPAPVPEVPQVPVPETPVTEPVPVAEAPVVETPAPEVLEPVAPVAQPAPEAVAEPVAPVPAEPVVASAPEQAVSLGNEDISQYTVATPKKSNKNLIVMFVLIAVLGAVAIYLNLDAIKGIFGK